MILVDSGSFKAPWCLWTQTQVRGFTSSIIQWIWALRASILCHRRPPQHRRRLRLPPVLLILVRSRSWTIRVRRSGNRIRLPSPGRAGRSRSTTSFSKLSNCECYLFFEFFFLVYSAVGISLFLFGCWEDWGNDRKLIVALFDRWKILDQINEKFCEENSLQVLLASSLRIVYSIENYFWIHLFILWPS